MCLTAFCGKIGLVRHPTHDMQPVVRRKGNLGCMCVWSAWFTAPTSHLEPPCSRWVRYVSVAHRALRPEERACFSSRHLPTLKMACADYRLAAQPSYQTDSYKRRGGSGCRSQRLCMTTEVRCEANLSNTYVIFFNKIYTH